MQLLITEQYGTLSLTPNTSYRTTQLIVVLKKFDKVKLALVIENCQIIGHGLVSDSKYSFPAKIGQPQN